MNYKNIFKIIGFLLMVLCFLELLCLAYCGRSGVLESSAARAFSISAMVSGFAALICFVFGGLN